ncbi:MAG: hypothetical protein HY896_07965 [Deltaproteobacteria bacterium]|nr:hypothetical protein [Deltaproteobacteria bacterium]
MKNLKRMAWLLVATVLAAGCSRPVIREHAQPSKARDTYLRIKRVAIFPLENYSETRDAEKTVDALLVPALRLEKIFTDVEDTRFTRDVMKKLKITGTDILDKEVVRKLGDEMNVQAILYGKILSYGKGKEKDASSQVTMDLAMVEPPTGIVLWVGNVTVIGGLTAGKIFGVTEGKTDVEVARDAVRGLTSRLADEVKRARDQERKGIVAELKKEEEIERTRLEKLKGETGKIQEQLDKARTDAAGIKDAAAREAQAVKSEMEMQKAALEAEKARTTAAQQDVEKEKLKVEMERKRMEEEKKKIEEARKKLEAAIKEEPVKEGAPPAAPAPAPAAPAPAPAAPSGEPAR